MLIPFMLALVAFSPFGPAGGFHAPFARGFSGSQALIYASDSNNSVIWIYAQSGNDQVPLGALTTDVNVPTGLQIESDGSLLVANTGTSGGNVLDFKAGRTNPEQLTDPHEQVVSVAQCPDGTRYAANSTNVIFGNGSVAVYESGGKKPARYITESSWIPVGVACDSASHVYVEFDSRGECENGSNEIIEFLPGGRGSGTLLPMSTACDAGFQIDKAGDIVMGTSTAVDFFKPNSATPFQVVPYSPGFATFTLDQSDQNVWLSATDNRELPNRLVQVSVATGRSCRRSSATAPRISRASRPVRRISADERALLLPCRRRFAARRVRRIRWGGCARVDPSARFSPARCRRVAGVRFRRIREQRHDLRSK